MDETNVFKSYEVYYLEGATGSGGAAGSAPRSKMSHHGHGGWSVAQIRDDMSENAGLC